jgi:surface polysaccharide O-acyltransferase-like enzyme
MLRDGASYHLWYIYMFSGLFLFFPIIGRWVQFSNKNDLLYFLLLWLCTIILDNIFQLSSSNFNFLFIHFSGYIGFPVLGYYLSIISFDYKSKYLLYCLMIIVGIVLTILGTFYLSNETGIFNEKLYSNLSLNIIFVSIGIFLFFKDFIKCRSRFVRFINKYSYGVYLSHPLIIFIFYKLGFRPDFINLIIGIPVFSLICFLSSILLVYLINKLPYGKLISG